MYYVEVCKVIRLRLKLINGRCRRDCSILGGEKAPIRHFLHDLDDNGVVKIGVNFIIPSRESLFSYVYNLEDYKILNVVDFFTKKVQYIVK